MNPLLQAAFAQRMRHIYGDSYRRARQLGYHGTDHDWETFVRVRANAENKKRPADLKPAGR